MPASIFSETELARLASFPEEIPGDDLIRAFTLTGADRDLVAIRRGAAKPLEARASALCPSLPRLRSAQFERSSAIRPPALSRTSSRSARTRFNPTLDASRRANSTSPRFGNTSGLPRVELAEVLIEVDSWTGFTQFFRHAGGARSRNPDLVRHVYAAILAQACNFGLTTMADIADLTYRQLAWTTDWYLREETLKAAFSALVDFHSTSCQLPLAEAWGGGTISSSDGQRFPVRGSAENATRAPEIFRPRKGPHFLHLDLGPVLAVRVEGHLVYGS